MNFYSTVRLKYNLAKRFLYLLSLPPPSPPLSDNISTSARVISGDRYNPPLLRFQICRFQILNIKYSCKIMIIYTVHFRELNEPREQYIMINNFHGTEGKQKTIKDVSFINNYVVPFLFDIFQRIFRIYRSLY